MESIPIYARNLLFLRVLKKNSQKEIADLIGKGTAMSIAKVEKGNGRLIIDDLITLADHFAVTETELLRHQFWRMSDEEILKLKRRWKEKEDTEKQAEHVLQTA